MTDKISFVWHLIKADIGLNVSYGSSVEVGVGSWGGGGGGSGLKFCLALIFVLIVINSF